MVLDKVYTNEHYIKVIFKNEFKQWESLSFVTNVYNNINSMTVTRFRGVVTDVRILDITDTDIYFVKVYR